MMREGSSNDPINPQEQRAKQNQPPQKCPRCDSLNTKFCYYNNYSLSQPRYFCKTCRRYWTQGGTLRNVPVGGGCRKGKRIRTSPHASSSSSHTQFIASNAQAQCQTSSGEPGRGAAPSISGGFHVPMINVDNTGCDRSFSGKEGHNVVGSFSTLPTCSSGGGGGGLLPSLTYPQGLNTYRRYNQPLSGDLVGGSSNLGLLPGYVNCLNFNASFATSAQHDIQQPDQEHFFQIESLDQKMGTSSMISTTVLFPSISRADSSASTGSHYMACPPQIWGQERGSFMNTMKMNDLDNNSSSHTSGHTNNDTNAGEARTFNPNLWPGHHHRLPGFGPPP